VNNPGGNVIIINGGGNVVINGNGGVVIVNGNVISPGGGTLGPLTAQRTVPVHLKLGAKTAKTLKKLSGQLLIQALKENEPLITMDNVLQAAGKTAPGKDGSVLQVQAVETLADGGVKVQMVLENPPGPNPLAGWPGGLANINGNINGVPVGSPGNLPKLHDAQGKSYAPAQVVKQQTQFNGGKIAHHATVIYRPVGAPTQLVLYGDRPVYFSVPFTLHNVPLP
jgi:hypothetical protein